MGLWPTSLSVKTDSEGKPFEFGYQAVKLMAQVLQGDKSVIPANKLVIVPTIVVNKTNVADFTVKLSELRGRK